MASDPFESAKFSLKRASRHARDFNTLANEFLESKPYTTWTKFNAVSGLNELRVEVIRDFPEDLRGFASDATKNIRDALDQTMSAATYVLTGKRPTRTHFPFGESMDDLEESLSRRRAVQCRDIPEELFEAIRHIRPYPHLGDEFRLKSLQRVSGPHKHSVSLSIGCSSPSPFAQIEMTTVEDEVITIDFPEWDSSKGNSIVATFSGIPNANVNFSVPFHIAFDHPNLKNIPASVVIDGWGRRSDWILCGLEKLTSQIVAERGG